VYLRLYWLLRLHEEKLNVPVLLRYDLQRYPVLLKCLSCIAFVSMKGSHCLLTALLKILYSIQNHVCPPCPKPRLGDKARQGRLVL
jgi:hypothetical protein